jgi:hypothetical protein
MKIVCEPKFVIEPAEVLLSGLVELGMVMEGRCMAILKEAGEHLGVLEVEMGNGNRMIRGNLMLKVELGRRGIWVICSFCVWLLGLWVHHILRVCEGGDANE